MYISNIKIRNYKNFYKSNINFQKKITTVIGENGVGKTNLFNAIRLLIDNNYKHFFCEDDFSYKLNNYKCHWIIISLEFSEVPNPIIEPVAAEFNPVNSKSVYTLIFRPSKLIRNNLYNLSQDYQNLVDTSEKENKKREIIQYIDSISIKNDYEIIKTTKINWDFLNDEKYKALVGDIDQLVFPNPDDVQENAAVIGDKEQKNIRNFINFTFIPAIRDVNSELTKSGNFLEEILLNVSSKIDSNIWKTIKNKFNDINDQMMNIDEYCNFSKNVSNVVNSTIGTVYSSDVFLDVSLPDEEKRFIKYFSLKGKVDEHNISLYNTSLGENNILYFALKLIQQNYQEGHTKKILNLIVIEEPEAHLHKHLQQTFFNGIRQNNETQIIMSTHSVHISESSKVSSMVVIGSTQRECEIYNPVANLNRSEIKYIERYLDATRNPILFSKNVMMVEGSAELIFIPNILKLKYNLDLNAYGISIISIDGCFFDNISLLFHKDRLKRKCSILTDEDRKINNEERNQKEQNLRIEKLQNLHQNNEYVNVFTNMYTFEIELYSKNIELFIEYLKENDIYRRDFEKMISELRGNKEIIYNRILKVAKQVGKGWLALNFIEWLSQKEKDIIKKFVIPDYIIDALKFLFSSGNYSLSTYEQIIKRYCLLMEEKEEKIDDKFINYIKECRGTSNNE